MYEYVFGAKMKKKMAEVSAIFFFFAFQLPHNEHLKVKKKTNVSTRRHEKSLQPNTHYNCVGRNLLGKVNALELKNGCKKLELFTSKKNKPTAKKR